MIASLFTLILLADRPVQAMPKRSVQTCRFRLVVASEPKTAEETWAAFSNWLVNQPQRVELTRAAYLAIIRAAHDGLGFGPRSRSQPFPYPRWSTLVNADRSASAQIEEAELRNFFYQMVTFEILQYSIGQGAFARGQPLMTVDKEIYQIAIEPRSLDALGLSPNAIRKMWEASQAIKE